MREAIADLCVPFASPDKVHNFGENRSKKVRELIALVLKDGGSRSELAPKYHLIAISAVTASRIPLYRSAW